MNNSNFRAAILVPAFLFAIGLALQLFLGYFPIEILKSPINIIVLGELFLMTILMHIFLKKTKLVKFLSSGHAAISAISLFVLLVIVMVMVPQDPQETNFFSVIGLTNITGNWIYILSSFYIIMSVGLVTIKRLFPINIRNIFFFINHFGLWLVIVTASLGSADKIKLDITVPEGEIIWYGYDYNDVYIEPDFAIRLNKFNIEFYQPKLAIVNDNGEMFDAKEFQPIELIEGETLTYLDFNIKVLKIYEDAIAKQDTAFLVAGMPEKTYVAQLFVNGDTVFVQNSTNFHPPVLANIDDDVNLAILNPDPKYFGSSIQLYTKDGVDGDEHLIEVNNPLRIDSWTIYQTSYFKTPEFEGYISVFSAVYDPWLKIVYVGLIMMLIGAIYLIFSRRANNKIKK